MPSENLRRKMMRIAAEAKINEMIDVWQVREQARHEKGIKYIPSHLREEEVGFDPDELLHPTEVEIDEETGEPIQKVERRGLEFKDTIEVQWIPVEENFQALFKEIPKEGEAEHTEDTLRDVWAEYGEIEAIKLNQQENKAVIRFKWLKDAEIAARVNCEWFNHKSMVDKKLRKFIKIGYKKPIVPPVKEKDPYDDGEYT